MSRTPFPFLSPSGNDARANGVRQRHVITNLQSTDDLPPPPPLLPPSSRTTTARAPLPTLREALRNMPPPTADVNEEHSFESVMTSMLLSDRASVFAGGAIMTVFVSIIALLIILRSANADEYDALARYDHTYVIRTYVWATLATVIFALTAFAAPGSRKRRLLMLLSCIQVICLVSYSVMSFGLAPVFRDAMGGIQYTARWIFWNATDSTMLLLMCNMDTRPQPLARVVTVIGSDIGMFVTGFIASAISTTALGMGFWCAASCAFQLVIIVCMHRVFADYGAASDGNSYHTRITTFLMWWLYVPYLWFPVVWIAAAMNLIDDDTTMAAYFVGELTAKLWNAVALLAVSDALWDNQEQARYWMQVQQLEIKAHADRAMEESRSAERAMASLQRQTEWIRYMLHEVRGPLNIAVLAAENVQSAILPLRRSSSAADKDDAKSSQNDTGAPSRSTDPASQSTSTKNALATSFVYDAPSMPTASSPSHFLSATPRAMRGVDTDPADCLLNLSDMREAVFHICRLLEDMMSLQRIEDGELVLEERPFALRNLAMAMERVFTAKAADKGQTFTCEVSDDVSAQVVGDEGRLRQVLHCLLDNAVTHTQRGGAITLTIARGDGGDVHGSGSATSYRLYVRDTGVGISPSDLERLFVPFVHVASGESMKGKKTGLGLSIMHKLVGLMGGALSVTSTVGVGTEFTVALPFRDVPDTRPRQLSVVETSKAVGARRVSSSVIRPPTVNASPVSPTVSSPTISPQTVSPLNSKRRFLVIDDSPPNRKLLARLLTRTLAAVCEEACDGRDAVNKVQDDVRRYDAIFCDKEMPVMDGHDAVREMRRIGVTCPIIGVTANAVQEDQKAFIECGLNDLVTKPVQVNKLLKVIKQAMK